MYNVILVQGIKQAYVAHEITALYMLSKDYKLLLTCLYFTIDAAQCNHFIESETNL